MFDMFRSSRDRSARSPAPAQDSQAPASLTAESSRSPQSVAHRDLLRVVLRDTLRMNGIPTEWLGCEIIERSVPGQPPMYQINLVIHRWHEGLLRYAPALQKQFLDNLAHFDPSTADRSHFVSWEFGANCACPYTHLPGPAYWKMAPEQTRFTPPTPANDLARDYDDYIPTAPGPL